MAEDAPFDLEAIRTRCSQNITEIVANPREYFRVQQILRDRLALLAEVDRLRALQRPEVLSGDSPSSHETSGDAYTRRIERKVAAIVTWLEANQPDAFRRGLWDAVEKAGGGSSEETKAPHEHRWVLPAAPLSATNYFCGDWGFFPGPSIPQLDVPTCPVAGTAEHRFMLWLMKEIPPGTVISSPSWWSPRIFKAVQRAMEIQQERGEASRNEGSSEKVSDGYQKP